MNVMQISPFCIGVIEAANSPPLQLILIFVSARALARLDTLGDTFAKLRYALALRGAALDRHSLTGKYFEI